jgi:hypothetical protein
MGKGDCNGTRARRAMRWQGWPILPSGPEARLLDTKRRLWRGRPAGESLAIDPGDRNTTGVVDEAC